MCLLLNIKCLKGIFDPVFTIKVLMSHQIAL